MKSLQGTLLIASPHLLDSNFDRTVVLMIQHNEDGIMGLVLNRPTDAAIAKVWSQVSQTKCQSEQRLHIGGPVPGPLLAIHTHRELSENEILPGLYLSIGTDELEPLIQLDDDAIRYYAGYAGWGTGQLESELNEGAWITAPAEPTHIFYDAGDDLWETVTAQITKKSIVNPLRIRDMPEDPTVN